MPGSIDVRHRSHLSAPTDLYRYRHNSIYGEIRSVRSRNPEERRDPSTAGKLPGTGARTDVRPVSFIGCWPVAGRTFDAIFGRIGEAKLNYRCALPALMVTALSSASNRERARAAFPITPLLINPISTAASATVSRGIVLMVRSCSIVRAGNQTRLRP